MKRLLVLTILSLFETSCSGQIWHEKSANPQAEVREKGVVYYDRFESIQYFEYTALVDDKGNVTGKACNIVPAYSQIAMMVDYGNPKTIYYEPGLLETYKFSPQLNVDGTLGSGAIESTPDRGEAFKNVTEGVGNLAKLGALGEIRILPGHCRSSESRRCPEVTLESRGIVEPACNGKPTFYTFRKIDMSKIVGSVLLPDPMPIR